MTKEATTGGYGSTNILVPIESVVSNSSSNSAFSYSGNYVIANRIIDSLTITFTGTTDMYGNSGSCGQYIQVQNNSGMVLGTSASQTCTVSRSSKTYTVTIKNVAAQTRLCVYLISTANCWYREDTTVTYKVS